MVTSSRHCSPEHPGEADDVAAATKKLKLFIPRNRIRAGRSPCDHCTGKCCRYFSLPIDTPTTWDDFDSIRWYLAHGKTLVYVEKGTWYLVVLTKCGYLMPGNRCGIYHDRPAICRNYTTDECEYDAEWSFEKVFESAEQIWEYAEAILPRSVARKPRRHRATASSSSNVKRPERTRWRPAKREHPSIPRTSPWISGRSARSSATSSPPPRKPSSATWRARCGSSARSCSRWQSCSWCR